MPQTAVSMEMVFWDGVSKFALGDHHSEVQRELVVGPSGVAIGIPLTDDVVGDDEGDAQ